MLHVAASVLRTSIKYKRLLLIGFAVTLLSVTAYIGVPNWARAQGTETGEQYLGTIEAIPGQVVEQQYRLSDGTYVVASAELNKPETVQLFIEAMQDAERFSELTQEPSSKQP